MEYLIGVIIFLVGGLFYVNRKKEKAEVKAIMAETKGQDLQLEKEQINIDNEIKTIDARIEELKKQRTITETRKADELSLADRAKLARNKFNTEN